MQKRKRSGIAKLVYGHLVQPFIESSAPISHISWGAAIGVFVAMTPTMGIQMYIVAVLWVFCRSLLRFHFNLPIAVAMVWISNPVTMVPLYYGFLATGELFLGLDPAFGGDFAEFRRIFQEARGNASTDWSRALIGGIALLFWRFGWPMLVGSLVWALPLAAITYPVTTFAMLRYRFLIARREGLTYAEWRKAHIHPD